MAVRVCGEERPGRQGRFIVGLDWSEGVGVEGIDDDARDGMGHFMMVTIRWSRKQGIVDSEIRPKLSP